MLFSIIQINAQHLELGASLGFSNYLGDLAPSSFIGSIGESHIATSIFSKYNFNDRIALLGSFSYGRIGSSDAASYIRFNNNFRKERNLSFRSDIFELAIIGEFNILGFQPYLKEHPFAPYIFGGIAVYRFNPQASFNGAWHDLQPLGTEGQGLANQPQKYKLTQFSIPFGAGIKFTFHPRISIGMDIGLRKTFTDYLDDVSNAYPDLSLLEATNGTLASELSWRGDEIDMEASPPEAGSGRGDPTDLDWYVFSKVMISYNFFNYSNSKGRGKPTSLKCPVF